MAAFYFFVDTGMKGAAVSFLDTAPHKAFRFQKNKDGKGIKLEPFADWLKNHHGPKHFVIEDPALVPRSLTTLAPQWLVVGQIYTLIELSHPLSLQWVNPNTWQAWARKEMAPKKFKDTKEMSKALATRSYKEWIEGQEFKTLHDGIADSLCLGKFFLDSLETELDIFYKCFPQ